MKRLAAPFLILALMAPAFAQDLKIYGGLDWARYREPALPIGITEFQVVFHANSGMLVGGSVEFRLFAPLGFDLGLQFLQKGARADYFDLGIPDGADTYNLSVLSLPATFKFKPFPGISPYVLAGGDVSYVVGHRRLYYFPSPQPARFDLLAETKRWDLGLVAGAGIEASLAARWMVFAEARYYLGLVDLANPVDDPILTQLGIFHSGLRTRALTVQAGLKFMLPGRGRT